MLCAARYCGPQIAPPLSRSVENALFWCLWKTIRRTTWVATLCAQLLQTFKPTRCMLMRQRAHCALQRNTRETCLTCLCVIFSGAILNLSATALKEAFIVPQCCCCCRAAAKCEVLFVLFLKAPAAPRLASRALRCLQAIEPPSRPLFCCSPAAALCVCARTTVELLLFEVGSRCGAPCACLTGA